MSWRRRAARFIYQHRVHWAMLTVLMYGGTIPVLVLAFPQVSNLTIAILSLMGSFTASITALADLLTDEDDS